MASRHLEIFRVLGPNYMHMQRDPLKNSDAIGLGRSCKRRWGDRLQSVRVRVLGVDSTD